MQSVSQRFLNTTRTSAKVVVVADLYLNGALAVANLPVTDASVSMDIESDILRSASISVVEPGQNQSGAHFTLDLLSCEVVLKSGYKYSNQMTETVSLGRFMVWSADKNFNSGEILDLELYDRAKYMEIAEIVRPLDYSGQMASFAIQDLVTRSIPTVATVTFETGLLDVQLPGGMTYDTNHLDAAIKIAESIGGKFTFDATGNPMVIKKPAITANQLVSTADFALFCGPDGNIVSLSKQLTREGTFNGVAVYGSATENGVQPLGEAFDLNPSSQTYWNGPFGKALKKVTKEELLTAAECIVAAQAELKSLTSNVAPVTLQILPNAALEPGDVVTVLYTDLVTTELHMIKSITFDLDEMNMQIITAGRSAISG